ncbi:class I adenylate-forming enzyme family protein [Caulobacter mirabilis]|uniref:3-methylmercaptopropionyl-CoA ligase n=1 Tax=Caulobacter mirabilis TaxID=69666 RepID=A0A2D2AY63_9CAUL|nr:AMP-binding protein [Caulobacter mirabilis]ATQ42922.1 AMP-binding enzyme [Caulobacter mirabilis]
MMTLGFLAEQAAAERPDAAAVIDLNGDTLTFADLSARARGLAGHFSAIGLRAGDRIGLAMSNHASFFEVLLGAWRAGLIVAPMNPRLHPLEFVSLMEDCGAGLCVATPDLAPSIAEAAPQLSILTVGAPDYREAVARSESIEPPPPVDAAWLFYTSGTTGKPKGATLTHANLWAMIESFLVDAGAAVDEAMLHTAPLSHAGGLLGLAFLHRGLPQIVMPTGALDASTFAAGLSRWSRSSFFAVPTLLNRMRDPDFLDPALHGRIHKIMFGGAPMYAEDLKSAIATFGPERLWGGYGQGEAPCTIAHLPTALLQDAGPHDRDEVLGSVGLPRSGVELRVMKPDGSSAAAGVSGEVLVRGAVVMSGYWNRPDDTAAALAGGWLRTGDIGRIGPTGLLTLVDRAKDMIISGGSNIYPREIEEALLRHPAVREIAVVGRHDAEWGEIPVAFVVLSAPATSRQLDEFCAAQIARYKRPREYRFIQDLPKSSYGKVLKSKLRDFLQLAHALN